jgi:hypothetical protein
MKNKIKVISKTITLGRQSVFYKELMSIGDHKLEIDIESNSYDFQSHARIKVFSATELKWNNLAEIHFGSMKTPFCMYVWTKEKYNQDSNFTFDRDELIRQAFLILN